MGRLLFVLLHLLAFTDANVFIRMRSQNDGAVSSDSVPTYLTLSIPPYTSNFHKGSDGLAHDIISEVETEVSVNFGTSATYRVQLIDAVGPGSPVDHSGMYGDIRDRRAHWAVGPFPRNYIHYPIEVQLLGNWLDVHLKFIVDNQSPLAVLAKEFDLASIESYNFRLEEQHVQLILVKDSVEHLFLNNTRNIISADYIEISNWLKKPTNRPILVSNLCEGLKLLEEYNGEEIAKSHHGEEKVEENGGSGGKDVRKNAVLVTTELMASHYASGKKHLKLVDPTLHRNTRGAPLTTYSLIAGERDQRTNVIETVLGSLKNKIRILVWKWMEYDENACEKLQEAFKSGASRFKGALVWSLWVGVMMFWGW